MTDPTAETVARIAPRLIPMEKEWLTGDWFRKERNA